MRVVRVQQLAEGDKKEMSDIKTLNELENYSASSVASEALIAEQAARADLSASATARDTETSAELEIPAVHVLSDIIIQRLGTKCIIISIKDDRVSFCFIGKTLLSLTFCLRIST